MAPVRNILAEIDGFLDRLPGIWGRSTAAAVLLLPAFVVLIAFGLLPMAYAVYMSAFDLTGTEARYVGLAHYREALSGDHAAYTESFQNSLLVTVYFALGTVPATLVLSFFIALGLSRIRAFRGFLRTAYFLPYVTSVVAAAMIWRVLLEPSYGVANQLLEAANLPAQRWLLEPRGVLHLMTDGAVPATVGPSLALVCVILFEIWRSTGFMVVVFLAGLAAVPRELEDAARVDGASGFRTIRSVVLPMLSPTIFFLAVVGVIGAFQAFSSFYALTGGRGPLNTTQNLTVYIYSNLYESGRLGYGAAVSVLLCAAVAGLTVLQWRVARRRVFYQ